MYSMKLAMTMNRSGRHPVHVTLNCTAGRGREASGRLQKLTKVVPPVLEELTTMNVELENQLEKIHAQENIVNGTEVPVCTDLRPLPFCRRKVTQAVVTVATGGPLRLRRA